MTKSEEFQAWVNDAELIWLREVVPVLQGLGTSKRQDLHYYADWSWWAQRFGEGNSPKEAILEVLSDSPFDDILLAAWDTLKMKWSQPQVVLDWLHAALD